MPVHSTQQHITKPTTIGLVRVDGRRAMAESSVETVLGTGDLQLTRAWRPSQIQDAFTGDAKAPATSHGKGFIRALAVKVLKNTMRRFTASRQTHQSQSQD